MAGYIHFTDEQKQRANSVDLVDFLGRQGEQLIRSGKEWRWKRHDSVTIRGNRWFRHSSRQGGLAIDFIQEFYGLAFPDAVTLLLNEEKGVSFRQSDKKASEPKHKEFMLPEAAGNMRRVYAYLLKRRYIDRDVLTHFVKEKKIFEDKKYHNAVFVGFDKNGISRHAHKRGTYSNAGRYRGNVEGSDPRYSFSHVGTSDSLYVFEAPIDMLSYISLHKNGWKQYSYVTLDGVAEHAMLQLLSQNKYLDNVILCLDRDVAGIEASGRLTEILYEKGYNRISCLQSIFKDWNEDLKAQHGITPVPAQEHPKIEACHNLCRELGNLCSSVKSINDPQEKLMEHYKKFFSFMKDGRLMYGKEIIAMEQLQSMATWALLAVSRQYCQIEKPVTIEQLTDQLFECYYPHQDKGRLRVKVDELQQDIIFITDQLHKTGIRTLDDKEKLISSCMSLALNCVKAYIFVDLKGQKQKSGMRSKANLNRSDCEQAVCEESVQPQHNLL